jgi:hypothetical protein
LNAVARGKVCWIVSLADLKDLLAPRRGQWRCAFVSLREGRVRPAGECSVPVSAFLQNPGANGTTHNNVNGCRDFVRAVGIDHGELRVRGSGGDRPHSRSPRRGSRTLAASISDTARFTRCVRRSSAGHPRAVGLDNRIILLDRVPMIRFPVAQHFWFFGYPTMLAAGGTRVI